MINNLENNETSLGTHFQDIDKSLVNISIITQKETSGELFTRLVSSSMPGVPEIEFKQSLKILNSIRENNKQAIDLAINSIKTLREIHQKFPITAGYTTILLETAIAASIADDNKMMH